MTEATSHGGSRGGVPEANRAVVEGALRSALKRAAERRRSRTIPVGDERVLLLRAAPGWRGPQRLTVQAEDGPVAATVQGCGTVLAVLDALSRPRDPGSYLVVLTPCDAGELGTTVLAQALGNEVRRIDRWDLVADAFGPRRLDPRLTRSSNRWLAEALLDAQPAGGWKRVGGPVLQLDTALARLAAVRFGPDGAVPGRDEEQRIDAAALLEWSQDDHQVGRFLKLPDEEQEGLIGWLERSVGPVAEVVFRLLRSGQAHEAISFGLAAAELYAAPVERDRVAERARIRAEERFLGRSSLPVPALHAFAEATGSLILRWSDNGRGARAAVLCSRAEEILGELRAGELAGNSIMLDAGLDARLADLADEITAALPGPSAADLGPVEAALDRLLEHRRGGDRAREVSAAVSAVRLLRWLVRSPGERPVTVAGGAREHLRSWGWADRATAEIFNAESPRARAAYAALFEAVRAERAELDRAFAERLAAWTATGGGTEDLLLAENVLERIARPVAERAAPLVVVLDGMSAAAACALAEEITAMRAWTEVGREPTGREPVLATIPSTTAFSRASLLCGRLASGGQSAERAGFAAFWQGRRSALFHKGDLAGGPGAALGDALREALQATGTVVGVVLNSIDDALAGDFRTGSPTWKVDQVDHLRPLLEAAETAGRPVILTSDHGHVLEYGSGVRPVPAESARHRTGTPGEGELAVRGPRVLATGGHVTVPWDERIRYLPRRAGYHGGVSPAEMVFPALVFVPDPALCPRGWVRYENPSLHEPPWWTASPDETPPAVPDDAMPDDGTLFTPEQATGEPGLGTAVVTSGMYAEQRRFVRKAPDPEAVAALVDALAAAGGRLPTAVAAQVVGRPPFRMAGHLSTLGRLLNVDGYQVVSSADEGRTVQLDVRLLKLQFLGEP
ncbi:BREX-2 system phosphatase PglZ [Actinomadura craniellae]|uniref:BREX-2 system phosphatase PglZ n=1 Tax=Actinomadura craniellae TaxID=2231787 RepID=A0A365HAH9_9ACTN|nr:BREX-2 system phosphatase PglZ [Actinomadura craniellae]RAY15936.1 BREX-2 system phosphatase PglZ [Actinomadura craniellae]